MIADLQIIDDKKLLSEVNNLTDNLRQPTWEADSNDGQWCMPEDDVIRVLKILLDRISKLETSK